MLTLLGLFVLFYSLGSLSGSTTIVKREPRRRSYCYTHDCNDYCGETLLD